MALTNAQLIAEIGTDYPDNTTGLITPALLRAFLTDFVNAAVLLNTTGFGGAVTQLTNRTTGVTLNTLTGAITLFSAAGSATPATFTVTNSVVGANDTIIINQKSGTNLYETFVTAVAVGSFNVTFFTTGGTAVDAPVFNFGILHGSVT